MTATKTPLDATTVRDWLVRYIGGLLDMPVATFPAAEPFESYGLEAVDAVIMAGVMEEEFGIELDPQHFFENPSVDGLVAALQRAGVVAG